MLPVLEYFQKLTHSYGWAIVLLTVFVRILVWPLVAQSTRSMQKMSKLQPQLKAIQERYKDDPELFQKKAMEFYSKNKVNPMSGCLPTLVQLPVLFALFATFTGPPFGDKPIDVKVNVVAAEKAGDVKRKETSDATSCYVSADGKMAKIAVFPGEMTITQGTSVDFGTRALKGDLPADFKVDWKTVPKGKDPKSITGVDDVGYHYDFTETGDYVVEAKVPAIAKNESFLFINSLGKVAKGMELIDPKNLDTIILIMLFGVTMFLSQKFTVSAPKVPEEEMTEQQLIQQQTMKTMPIAVTVMFFFIPLPTGVYLYMVVSNVIQTLQTWIIMKSPAPALVDVLGDDEAPSKQTTSDNGTGKKGGAPKSSDNGGTANKKKKASAEDNGAGEKINLSSEQGEKIPSDNGEDEPDWKRKSKKKKKK